ncbi:TetR/AcrR family transcriptional regulator [Desulfosporosinus nitroreducens]|uniref:TetR/AcrR family transcriptional regulator n=1 Tax=Desulfosporosinus nitroreducens TaxID=2018668 RepID=A0ABT8QPQ5_9FIRM|nr:TetR/AcrR family transcriptional regulator [Desulfosporosinus nitroreducens]MDO0822554.1 TetR/AcrR family transcriptional regulator [Desulfosporosinus nitroreducens]
MLNTSNDRRTIRTKKMIRNALSELIEEKGFNHISITDLTRRADINRGTFYLHYDDKFDLLEKVENEVLQELYAHHIGHIDFLNIASIDTPMPYMIKILKQIRENATFMKAILSPKGDPAFYIKLKQLLETKLFEKRVIQAFERDNLLIPDTFFVAYVVSAHIGVIQEWLVGGMEQSPEDMALILSKMFFLGPFRVSGFKYRAD